MGTFTFKWQHPASEVYVTGTFDDWGKTVKLDKNGSVFEKSVELSDASSNIYYKFVVDGNWTTDHTAPQENDGQNNLNNVLTPERISKPSAGTFATMSTVTPASTTAQLAGSVPRESRSADPSGMPGDFPETPQQEASEFAVKPIPATAGAGNPISLRPGEKVPDPQSITANTVGSTVTTDKASYERGGSATNAPPVLPNPVTPQTERDQKGYGVLDLPPVSNNTIPESSLPMGSGPTGSQGVGPHISSVAPQSTTAGLAGQVPLQARGGLAQVPDVVQESQAKARVGPEAGASTEAVREKSAVERELQQEVPKEPSTSEGTSKPGRAGTTDKEESSLTAGKVAGVATGTAAAAGAAAYATATTVKDKAAETTGLGNQTTSQRGGIPDSITQSIAQINSEADQKTATGVPEIVADSQKQAHYGSEAAGNAEAVTEKRDVESELLHSVTREDSAGRGAHHTAAGVPEIVGDSQDRAHYGAEAAANPEAVTEKRDVERELLSEIPTEQSTGKPAPTSATAAALSATAPSATTTSKTSDGLAAPASSQAATPATKQASVSPAIDSRDVSPMTKSPHQTQPVVTSGVGESKTDKVTGSTPNKSTGTTTGANTNTSTTSTPTRPSTDAGSTGSPSNASGKKEKRRSGFFGKLKEKMKH